MSMLEEREDEIIQIRRHLHENPELSFEEEKTAQYIVDFFKVKMWKFKQTLAMGMESL